MTQPLPQLSSQGKERLDKLLTDTVAKRNLPALFFAVANKEGPIYANCAGDNVFGEPDKGSVDQDTTLQLFSMTKLVTSVACLQLAERGLVSFDDPEVINKHLPELVSLPILEGYTSKEADAKPILKERTRPITLRNLLTHTSGEAYNFLSPLQTQWEQENKHPQWTTPGADPVKPFCTPLLFEPGSRFMYSTGIDWAGVLVWRVTGQTLEEYFDEHIFRPCGTTTLSFRPHQHIKDHLMGMCVRGKDGKLIVNPGLRDIPNTNPEDVTCFSGGGGLLGTAKDYLGFLTHLLRCQDKPGLISPDSFKLLFTNALPPRDGDHTVYQDLGLFLSMIGGAMNGGGDPEGKQSGHSLGMGINIVPGPNGRPAFCGFWGGAATTMFWMDPTTGIVTFCGTQLIGSPEYPNTAFNNLYAEFERAVYAGLQGTPNAAL